MESVPSYRSNAIWAGILFIIATAFLFVGEAFYGPALSDPDVLAKAAGAESDIELGVLIEFACVLAIPLIAVALYPVLRRVSVTLAIGYLAFRLFEAAVFFQMEVDRLQVLAISREIAASPTANTEQIDLLIRSLAGGEAWSGTSGSLYDIVFVTGMLMLNWMLWKSRLVPRLIAGWGMISAVLLGGLAMVVLRRGLEHPRHHVDRATRRAGNGPGAVVHLQGVRSRGSAETRTRCHAIPAGRTQLGSRRLVKSPDMRTGRSNARLVASWAPHSAPGPQRAGPTNHLPRPTP